MQFEKVHPFNAKNDAKNEKEETIITSNECTKEKQVAITELSGVAEIPKNITTKCLKDILLDSESETFDFSSSSSASENFHEVIS